MCNLKLQFCCVILRQLCMLQAGTNRSMAMCFGRGQRVIIRLHLLDLVHQSVYGVLGGLARQEQADALADAQVGLCILHHLQQS